MSPQESQVKVRDQEVKTKDTKSNLPTSVIAKSQKKTSKGRKVTKSSGKKTSRRKKENYSTYIYRVLKQVHPDIGISSKSMDIMNSFMNDIFDRIAGEAGNLVAKSNSKTMNSRDIQSAVKLVLPGDLLPKHSVCEGIKAINNYNKSKQARGV